MRDGMFSPKRIDTLVAELCKNECPMKLVIFVTGPLEECDNLAVLLKFLLIQWNDVDLWKLYDRVLYHTRYKAHRKLR